MYSKSNNKNKCLRSRKYGKKSRNRQSRKLRKYRGGVTNSPAGTSPPAGTPPKGSAVADLAKPRKGFKGFIDGLKTNITNDNDLKRMGSYQKLFGSVGEQIKKINEPTVEEKKKQLTNDLPNLVKKAIEMHKSEQYKHHESSKKLKKVDDENKIKLDKYKELYNGQQYRLPEKEAKQIKAMLQEFKTKTDKQFAIPEMYKLYISPLDSTKLKSSTQQSSSP